MDDLCTLQPDYLALELLDASVRFSWNTGAEDASVTHSLGLEEEPLEGEEWFDIQAERWVQKCYKHIW